MRALEGEMCMERTFRSARGLLRASIVHAEIADLITDAPMIWGLVKAADDILGEGIRGL
jgi:hypothetical protein